MDITVITELGVATDGDHVRHVLPASPCASSFREFYLFQ